MRRMLLMMMALGIAVTAGASRLYADAELIADEESSIPCTDGSGPQCAKNTTTTCNEWRTIEYEIGTTGGSTRVCSSQTTTTTYYYIRYP